MGANATTTWRRIRKTDVHTFSKKNAGYDDDMSSLEESFLVAALRRLRRHIICHDAHVSPDAAPTSRSTVTHHKYPRIAHSKTFLPVPALPHPGVAHMPSPSAETTYNRSKTVGTVPRSSIHTQPALLRPHRPQNARSTASAQTPRHAPAVARRSNPCCTSAARPTWTRSETARTMPRPRATDSTTSSAKIHPAAQAPSLAASP